MNALTSPAQANATPATVPFALTEFDKKETLEYMSRFDRNDKGEYFLYDDFKSFKSKLNVRIMYNTVTDDITASVSELIYDSNEYGEWFEVGQEVSTKLNDGLTNSKEEVLKLFRAKFARLIEIYREWGQPVWSQETIEE